MKKRAVVLGSILMFLSNIAFAETITVPATANPWLAGLTNGASARRGDLAPDESPVQVTTGIEGGAVYVFSASGSANHGATLPLSAPEGEADLVRHYLGAENGIADLTAPFTSLVGVFLDDDAPDQTPAPAPLDFRKHKDRDYKTLRPELKQPFYIGSGLNSSAYASCAMIGPAGQRKVVAPRGATRLYLGVMDEYFWHDNEGQFSVTIELTAATQKADDKLLRLKMGGIQGNYPAQGFPANGQRQPSRDEK